MAAIVTDQFRILNASNFVGNVTDSNNSYYVFVGLSNPTTSGFGRKTDFNTDTPSPTDNINYMNFVIACCFPTIPTVLVMIQG